MSKRFRIIYATDEIGGTKCYEKRRYPEDTEYILKSEYDKLEKQNKEMLEYLINHIKHLRDSR